MLILVSRQNLVFSANILSEQKDRGCKTHLASVGAKIIDLSQFKTQRSTILLISSDLDQGLPGLGDEDMGGGAEQHHGGDQGEHGEGHQAEPVQHDGRVLPVVHHQHGLLTGPDGVGDNSEHRYYLIFSFLVSPKINIST